MYVHKVTLEQLRGFESLEFELVRPDGSYAGWTVFTGDNGSGKSALLRAIAIGLLGADASRPLQPSFRGWIRKGAPDGSATIELQIVQSQGDDNFRMTGRLPAGPFKARLRLENGSSEPRLSPESSAKNRKTAERSVWASEPGGWFACGYGPFRRVFGASQEATKLMVVPATARFATMFQEAASLSEADAWLRNLQHKKLEGRARESSQLDALVALLNSDLLPNGFRVDRVDSDGLWVVDRSGVQLSWHEMSDGYRSAIALVVDIARHMLSAYGEDPSNAPSGISSDPFCRSGVVLIDEVDAHLHPEWQREFGFWLTENFRGVQFLVTTHSPLICQAASEGGLFHLPEPGSAEVPRQLTEEEWRRVIAARPDTILLGPAFQLQNTRSPRAVQGRVDYVRLASKRRAGAELTPEELAKFTQLELFVKLDEEL